MKDLAHYDVATDQTISEQFSRIDDTYVLLVQAKAISENNFRIDAEGESPRTDNGKEREFLHCIAIFICF